MAPSAAGTVHARRVAPATVVQAPFRPAASCHLTVRPTAPCGRRPGANLTTDPDVAEPLTRGEVVAPDAAAAADPAAMRAIAADTTTTGHGELLWSRGVNEGQYSTARAWP